VSPGELQRAPRSVGPVGKVGFSGRERADVKRKALDFWYHNRAALNLTMRDFSPVAASRPDGRSITFHRNIDGPPVIG
jgi:hypothetical protein